MAASSWSGFSEEDQAKIKRELTDKRPLSNGGSNDRAPELIAGLDSLKTNKNNKPKKNLIAQTTRKIDSNNQDDVPLGALLSTKPKQGPESPSHVKLKIVEDSSSFEIMETVPLDNKSPSKDIEKIEQKVVLHSPHGSPSLTLSVDLLQNGEKKEPMNLDEFEKRQKLIEEQNRLKKEMLGKALALRKMKTQAEAQKLGQIQDELSKLDASLSNDVCILRSHIEIASTELSEAEKRYSKAEREFIDAKQLLFSKRERKELLTEHLCAIIEQNELRKAHRLTDLMVQLNEEDQKTNAALNQIGESQITTDEV